MQTAPNPLYCYRFAGRVVWSQISLPALPIWQSVPTSGTDRSTDLHIAPPVRDEVAPTIGAWLHEWRDDDGQVQLQVAISDSANPAPCYRLRFPDFCDFLLEPETGRVQPLTAPDLDPDTLEHLLLDQVLPRLLSQQGELVLHASVVRIDGRVALFLGRSGWGKSTLAGLLAQAGHRPLSDDCAVLRIDGDQMLVAPTYASLRLYEDTIGQTFLRTPDSRPVADYSSKRRVKLRGDQSEPTAEQVAAIYLLDDPYSGAQPTDKHTITALPPAAACMALVEHNFRLDIRARAQSAQVLSLAAEVARRLPAYSLSYPRDFQFNRQLTDMLTQHFSTIKPTVSGHM